MQSSIEARETSCFHFLEGGVGTLGQILPSLALNRSITIQDAGATFDTHRVLASQQKAVPRIAPKRVFLARRDIGYQSLVRRLRLKDFGNLLSEKTMPAQVRRRAPGAITQIDGAGGDLLTQSIDSRDCRVVKIAGQNLKDAYFAGVDSLVDFWPFARWGNGKNAVDLKFVDEVREHIGADIFILRTSYLDPVKRFQRLGSLSRLREPFIDDACRQKQRAENYEVEPDRFDIPGNFANLEIQVEAPVVRVTSESVKLIPQGRARRILVRHIRNQEIQLPL